MALENGFNLGTAYAKVLIDESGVDAGLSSVSKKFGSLGENLARSLQSVGSQLTGLGTALTGLGAPIAAGFGAALKTAMGFDEAIRNIGAVLNLTTPQMNTLGEQLRDIGSQSAAGPQAVANAYYDIAGGVADASTHMAILQAAIKTSEAGNADLTGTTNALISVMNAYGFAADKAATVSDVLTRTVGMGVGTMDEFASALPQVTGIANSLGISFEDVGKMMAYLTTKGNSASESATQLSGLMVAMLKPNEKMAKALKELGFQSGAAAIKQLGLAGAYKAISGTQTAQTEGIAELTGRVEALRAVTSLGGSDVESFFSKFSDGVSGATDAAQAIQSGGITAQWDKFNSQIQAVAITLGTQLFPVLQDLFRQLEPIITQIGLWITANPEIVQAVALLAAGLVTIGPILIAVGMAIGAIGTVIGFILSPIGLVIAAVIGLYVAFQNNFLGIRDFLQPIIDQIVDFFNHFQDRVKLYLSLFELYLNYYLINRLRDLWTTVQPALQSLLNWFVSDGIPWIQNALLFLWNNVLTPVINVLSGIWEAVKKGLTDLWTWFTAPGGGLDTIKAALKDIKERFIDPLVLVLKGIWTAVQPALEEFKKGIESVFNWIRNTVITPLMTTIDNLLKKIDELRGINNTSASTMTGGLPPNMTQPTVKGSGSSGNPLAGIGGMFYGPNSNDIQNAINTINAGRAGSGVVPIPKARAYGGDVLAGMKYTVGERGAETFTAPTNGTITPAGEGSGGLVVNIGSINANSEAGGRAAARGFKEELEMLWQGRGN